MTPPTPLRNPLTFEGSFSAVSKPILRPNTHFSAFFEIYKIHTLLHRPKFGNLAKFEFFRPIKLFSDFFLKMFAFSLGFVIFRINFDGFFSEFHEFS